MKNVFFLTVALIFILMPGVAKTSDTIEANLDALMGALLEQTGVPGLSAAVSVRGDLIWQGEAGFADVVGKRPVVPETIFRLASVSKAVCSVMAANLVEDGSIDVDARAGDLMPDLPKQYHSLTLRDLMTHTSGLPHYEARDFARGRKKYSSAVAGLEQLGDRDVVSSPGTSYLYSTHGFSLASAMMERVTEKTFTELLDGTIRASGVPGAVALESENEDSGRRTLIYAGVRNGKPREIEREDFSYSWCGAGMESTAAGLSNFASSLFDLRGSLSRRGRLLLTEPMPDRHGDIVVADRWVMTLGWRRSTDVRGEPFIHHAGVTNGARSILAIWPKYGLAVSLLSNASWTGRMEDTAAAFALAATRSSDEKNCASLKWQSYRGLFREEPIDVTIKWQDSSVPCRGQLTGDNALTKWLSQFNFGSPNGHALIRFDENWWGLVTPIGISILTGDATSLSGSVGSGSVTLGHKSREDIK